MVCVSPEFDSKQESADVRQAPALRWVPRVALATCAALFLAACQTAGLNQASGTLAASQAVNIASLTEVIASNPQDPGAYNMRGTAYGREGRSNDALADFNQALALNPGFYQALANRALIHRELGNDAQALADYSAAINANPAYDAAYVGRGNIYREAGRFPEALADYEEQIQAAEKKAEDLNRRFAQWYYVIPGQEYDNLSLNQEDLVQPKQNEDGTPVGEPQPNLQFNLPTADNPGLPVESPRSEAETQEPGEAETQEPGDAETQEPGEAEAETTAEAESTESEEAVAPESTETESTEPTEETEPVEEVESNENPATEDPSGDESSP